MVGEESYSELKCPHPECDYKTLRYLMGHRGHEMLDAHIEKTHGSPPQTLVCTEVPQPPATKL